MDTPLFCRQEKCYIYLIYVDNGSSLEDLLTVMTGRDGGERETEESLLFACLDADNNK